MAELVISPEYALVLRSREGYVDASGVEAEIREVRGDRGSRDQRYTLYGTAGEVDGWVQARLVFTTTLTDKERDRLQWTVRNSGPTTEGRGRANGKPGSTVWKSIMRPGCCGVPSRPGSRRRRCACHF